MVLTSAGSAAGLDLCLHIVRGDFGADAANSVRGGLGLAGASRWQSGTGRCKDPSPVGVATLSRPA